MPKRPLTNEDGEVRPLTAEDFQHFKPIQEVDPGMIEAAEQFRRRGRPATGETPKLHIGFRLAADVVNAIRATGQRLQRPCRESAARRTGEGRVMTGDPSKRVIVTQAPGLSLAPEQEAIPAETCFAGWGNMPTPVK